MTTSVPQLAALLAGAVALVGPAHAEWSALQRIKADAARCTDGAEICGGVAQVDVDLHGVRAWTPWREHGGLHVEADQVVLGLTLDGIEVDAHGVAAARSVVPAAPPAPANDVDRGPEPVTSPTEPTPPRRPVLHTHGVPVTVRVHGPTQWSQAGVTLGLSNASLHLDGHGSATARFEVTARGRGLSMVSPEPWTATAIEGDPRRWIAEGPVRIAEGPPTNARVRLGRTHTEAILRDDGGGQLVLERADDGTLAVQAEGFALSSLGNAGARTLATAGIDPSRAIVHGSAQLRPAAADGAHELTIDTLSIHGLVIDQPKLARTPVSLDGLSTRGTVRWRGEVRDASLWVAHRDAEATITAHLDPDRAELHAELAPLSCQALLDAMPNAMVDMIDGTRVQGQTGGSLDLAIDRAQLRHARAQTHRPHDAPPPGSLDLSFPFLEQCAVVRDDPRIDLAALPGPYRHRFVDHDGHAHARLMARGGPSFAAVAEVPLLARAFVALEDRRFWKHDGFDREQMANALWHNVVEGRVRRGASTISQQAARNLWLGIDRSWGRKLQEALLTARLEATTSKVRIMELYLNVIELGPGVHGVADAAQLYFGKPASSLNALQAVHIAAMAPAPNRLAKRFEDGHVDADWLDKLRDHVRRMHRAGFITRAQRDRALSNELGLLDRR